MKTRTTFILSLTIIITLAAGSAFGAYSGGTGEPNNPYQIATEQDLLDLAGTTADYGKCFILTADVNLQGQVFMTAIIAPDTSSDYWFQGTVFTGTFDGDGHKITNFTINGGSNSFLGLFGQIYGGSVKNLGLENCAVSGYECVGGLVGWNDGNISNCYSTGAVSGPSTVGGLVGGNSGSITNCYSTGEVTGGDSSICLGGLVGQNYYGTISNCYSTGAVSGSSGSSCVGGLVGWNNGTISNCYSTGSVSGSSGSSSVGGLVGMNYYGAISNCYSTGAVSGTSEVGGLVGNNSGDSISNCYSTGTVSGSFNVGGLVGYSYGSVSSSFWDTQTSGQTTSTGGTGKTTAQMKTLLTFTSANWDFVEIWGIGENQTYPYLRTQSAVDLNNDKKVDFADFAILASHWLE